MNESSLQGAVLGSNCAHLYDPGLTVGDALPGLPGLLAGQTVLTGEPAIKIVRCGTGRAWATCSLSRPSHSAASRQTEICLTLQLSRDQLHHTTPSQNQA